MFVVDLTFDCYQDTTLDDAERAINRVVNALRFNCLLYTSDAADE